MFPEEYSYHGVGRFVISGGLGVLFPNLRKSGMKLQHIQNGGLATFKRLTRNA
jgi:hypothetical protein